MKRYFMILFILSICPAMTYAWTSYTHTWICEHAGLSDIDCTNADNPKVQSTNPGINFRYHHCDADSYNCAARLKAREYLAINTTLARGFAAHLYADSQVPVHWYSFDYDTCHKIFEDKVEEKLRESENVKYELFKTEYDLSSWNVTMQCPAKNKGNMTVELYVDDRYMLQTAKYVASEMKSGYLEDELRIHDLTPIVYVFITLLVVVLTLFIIMGMKNRKNNNKNKK